MPYNPQEHHRRSIRLKGYDYGRQGCYFVTICVQDRLCLFGAIADGVMHLNEAGKMAERWYLELEKKFPGMECGVYQVMPNHIHCIIIIGSTTGADPDTRPESYPDPESTLGDHHQSPLWQMLQWFKTMTTNEYIRGVKNLGWPRFRKKLWQRDYWEHIIRDERAFDNISTYILNNPKTWHQDSLR